MFSPFIRRCKSTSSAVFHHCAERINDIASRDDNSSSYIMTQRHNALFSRYLLHYFLTTIPEESTMRVNRRYQFDEISIIYALYVLLYAYHCASLASRQGFLTRRHTRSRQALSASLHAIKSLPRASVVASLHEPHASRPQAACLKAEIAPVFWRSQIQGASDGRHGTPWWANNERWRR